MCTHIRSQLQPTAACSLLQPCVSHNQPPAALAELLRRDTQAQPTQLLRHTLMHTVVRFDCHAPAPCDSQKPRHPQKAGPAANRNQKKTTAGQCSVCPLNAGVLADAHPRHTLAAAAAALTGCGQNLLPAGVRRTACPSVSKSAAGWRPGRNERATAIEPRSSSAISKCVACRWLGGKKSKHHCLVIHAQGGKKAKQPAARGSSSQPLYS